MDEFDQQNGQTNIGQTECRGDQNNRADGPIDADMFAPTAKLEKACQMFACQHNRERSARLRAVQKERCSLLLMYESVWDLIHSAGRCTARTIKVITG
jgi:hypothetical protein